MNPLKRQRPNLEPADHRQKRACSDQSHANFVQCTRATQLQISITPRVQTPFVVPERCIHKIATACSLTQATCCACLDARPDGFKFARYMDGHFWGLTQYRWQYYCPDCRAYWSSQDDLGQRHQRPLGVPKEKESFPDAIRISYMAEHIDITRSVDLTLDGLKAEVARLMRCNPTQLMASDIALYNGRVVPGMPNDNALVSRATHVKFERVTNVESEDVEMDDVQA
ncbi:hypothetical protein SVAN01_00230 [Stagonosporopsis vannaccii]|nr:hypothetical protein SVAN01_00230 [Stagonosporopsis vannaccii]